MFGIGFSELLVIGVLALILVGPEQLPGLARTVGRFINDLKRSADGIKEEIKTQVQRDLSVLPDLNSRPTKLPAIESHQEISQMQDENYHDTHVDNPDYNYHDTHVDNPDHNYHQPVDVVGNSEAAVEPGESAPPVVESEHQPAVAAEVLKKKEDA